LKDSQLKKPLVYIVDASTDITGAFICARNEARLLRDSADIAIVLPTSSRIGCEHLEDFHKVVRLPIINIRKSLPSLIAYLPALLYSGWRLSRHLKSVKCERLQINDFYLMHGIVARFFGFRGRLVTWVRIDPRRFGPLLSRIWLTLCFRYSSKVIAVSQFVLDLLPKSQKIKLIYDPVFLRSDTEGGARSYLSCRIRNLIYIGNYITGKGQQHAIAAFDGLAGGYPGVHLHFYGSDMGLEKNRIYHQTLEEQALVSLYADRIHFHGFVDDIDSVLKDGYVSLNLSESESFSLSCLEASYHGLPVVATKSGGPEEIIVDGETGFLVEKGDVDAMRRAIVKLLENEPMAMQMGAQGSLYVKENFSSERFTLDILEIYGVA